MVTISFYSTVVYQVFENKNHMCTVLRERAHGVCILVTGGEQEVLRIIGDKKELRSILACASIPSHTRGALKDFSYA